MKGITLKHIYKVYSNIVPKKKHKDVGFEQEQLAAAAVKDFNLEIQDKEFLVLVGPSGCGKSTTLRMIAGLEDITKGELYINDNLVNDVEPKDRDIAMVFQNYALYPHMTVFDNMAFGLKLRKMPKGEIKKNVEEAAEILGITEYLKRKPKALSGGQRQRVALGRAIVRNPAVFLMDEPLSNLDAKLRVQMRTEILKLHQRLKTTFIYVTHDQTEAMTMGTRIVVMKDGIVQQVDSPTRLYDKPVNKFVAEFIGSPQMNMFEGRLEKKGDDTYAVLIDGTSLLVDEERAIRIRPDAYGKDVYIGIRPEDIYQNKLKTNSLLKSCMDIKVDVAEQTGADLFLYATVCGKELAARVEPSCIARSGETVKVAWDTSKLHVFDMTTQQSCIVWE